jgi:hypothetical protein
MSPESHPVIQILSIADYTTHYLVSQPQSPAPLLPNSLRLRTTLISLTANNLTYARVGRAWGWHLIHPVPTSGPFSDPDAYHRISAWGYAKVIESTSELAAVGTEVFGYVPIGTLPWDLEVAATETGVQNQLQITSEHRKGCFPVWNRLTLKPETDVVGKAWDALLQPLFETAWLMNAFGFGWEEEKRIHPQGEGAAWSKEDADLGKTVLMVFAASSKTAMIFAQLLRRERPSATQPLLLVGVTSEGSRGFVERSELFDSVLLYGDVEKGKEVVRKELEEEKVERVIVHDFGGRDGAVYTWYDAIKPLGASMLYLAMGTAVKPMSEKELAEVAAKDAAMGRITPDASNARQKVLETKSERDFFREFEEAWIMFKKNGAIPGMELRIRKGMDEVGNGWEELTGGEIGPGTGLLFEL